MQKTKELTNPIPQVPRRKIGARTRPTPIMNFSDMLPLALREAGMDLINIERYDRLYFKRTIIKDFAGEPVKEIVGFAREFLEKQK